MTLFKTSLFVGIMGLMTLDTASAASARTQQIISKKNRTLKSPSRDITAYKEDAEARYRSESRRLAQTDIEGVDNPDPTVKDENDDGGEESASSSDDDKPRRKNRTNQASTGFSGQRTFSFGFVGGGSYGVFGLDFEIAAGPNWAFGGGLGTGMAYSTWDLHGKYYFNTDGRVEPFAQFGYANWNLRRISPSGEKGRPQYLTDRFFADKDGRVTRTRQRHLIYPAVGVLLLTDGGLGVSAQLLYLISLSNTAGALYGGVGCHLFF